MPGPPAWSAEVDVDPDLAARLIAAQFPDLAGASVEHLASGWDNTVHLVDRTWVFRFPRRAVAVAGLRRESTLLPQLAARLPLAVPVPVFHGLATEAFSWDFHGSRFLPGRELASGGLPEQGRDGLGAQLGAFLRVLHDPAMAVDLGDGLPVDPMSRSDPAARWAIAAPWVARLQVAGLWSPGPAVAQLLEQATPLGPSRRPPVLSHGDLHLRHVLADDHAGAAAVIDWGDVCLADPSVDLSLAYGGFVGTSRQAFLRAYGYVDEPTERRARVLALSLCAAIAAHAADTGDRPTVQECLRGLDRAVA